MTEIRAHIRPRARDLGGFEVRRILPAAKLRNVGPFVFMDEMGPADFAPGTGVDVRPHPHIGLATITYLFDGEMTHRDSTGAVASIRPGDVNLMTAGRGVTHSERTGADARAAGHRLHGLQTWIALPKAHEETAPAFSHTPGADLPRIEANGVTATVVCGTWDGAASPVETLSDVLYVIFEAHADGAAILPATDQERAVYLIDGAGTLAGETLEPNVLAALDGGEARLELSAGARAALVGGAPLDGPRTISWNFVSSSPERIAEAERDWTQSTTSGWRDGPFAPPVDDADEYIPLPERKG